MKEAIHKYNHEDIRLNEHGEPGYPFMFMADVAQDNANLFVLEDGYIDNQWIAQRLQDLGAVTEGVKLDGNPTLFYAYFTTNKLGCEFLRKLSAWLIQKGHLLDKARDY